MCIPHAPAKNYRQPSAKRSRGEQKRKIPFNKALMKPDPDFVDERIAPEREGKKGFWKKITDFFR
ncbi:hypothetical protein [Hydrogenimonas sp. SS33]|uniref:hypothetical protein n=1 Tax=Hydrogenimonas leucolamina TaxID=2954236 RepID=UPI00336C0989